MDVNTAEPLDILTPLARRAIEQLGSPSTSVSGVLHSRDPAVFSAISQGPERANQKATSNAQKVFILLLVATIQNLKFIFHVFPR